MSARQTKRERKGGHLSFFKLVFAPHPLSQQSMNIARVKCTRQVLLEVKSAFKVATDVRKELTQLFFNVFKGNKTNFGSIDISIDLPDKLIHLN